MTPLCRDAPLASPLPEYLGQKGAAQYGKHSKMVKLW